MTALERATECAAMLNHVGRRWPQFLPHDAAVRDDCVWLQGVRMAPIPGGWRLTEGNRAWVVPTEEEESS